MQFNVVIGNPPYNKGMDLDFVDLAYKLSTEYVCMITPAKWQTTADDYRGCASKNIDYKGFREKLVPHMSYVCFYPCCKDVFDILQVDGITYFLIDKNSTFEQCTIENKSKYIKKLIEKSIEKRSILHRESLINVGNQIFNYVKSNDNYKQFQFVYIVGNKKYQVWTNSQTPGGALSTLETERKTLFIGDSTIEEYDLNLLHSNASSCTFEADSKEECQCFISWLNTRFTQFFLCINQSKLTGCLTNDCFRFVPAPPSGKFDHIYTDQELYQAFNLPQKYIDVIEAVIKERK